MTAHQPAREGDGGSANIDKECPVPNYYRLLFGSLFFLFGDLRKTACGAFSPLPVVPFEAKIIIILRIEVNNNG